MIDNPVDDLMRSETDEFAHALGFGDLRAWQRSDAPAATRTAVISASITGGLILVYAIVVAVTDQRDDGAWYHASGLFAVALLPFVLAIWFSSKARRRPVQWLYIYDSGVVLQQEVDDPIALAWDEVESLTRLIVKVKRGGTVVRTDYRVRITGAGRTIALTEVFGGVEDLTDRISAQVMPRILARATATIEAGGRVDFGGVTVDHAGLEWRGSQLRWADLGEVTVADGSVRIGQRGERKPWASVVAGTVPNLPVFLTLADTLRSAHP